MNGAFMFKDMDYASKGLILAIQLGYKNGKKDGQGLAEELMEVAKRHPDWVTFLGNTKGDSDLMTGELRQKGLRVFNPNEEKRKNEYNSE